MLNQHQNRDKIILATLQSIGLYSRTNYNLTEVFYTHYHKPTSTV